ncbi:MAG: hypothetical protein JWM18_1352 [Chloroflexi bacterium]|jgi:hypothetical protein|nr:hypothetical protein [Chloroflexota bacterium]
MGLLCHDGGARWRSARTAPVRRQPRPPGAKEVQRSMFRLNRWVRVGAVVGLLAAAAPVAVTRAATPTAGAVGLAAPAAVTNPLDLPVPQPPSQGDLQCLGFSYNLGPFGPLGPWGPYGPLHDKPHPACFGGGPQFNK